MTHKLSKVAAAKKVFLQCVCYRYNLLRSMFFILCDNWKTLFFSKSLSLLWDFFNHHVVVFFETSVLKEVHILHYLHNTSAMLIPMFQKNAIVYYTYTYLINFRSWLMIAFFILLYFLLFFTFLYKWAFFRKT